MLSIELGQTKKQPGELWLVWPEIDGRTALGLKMDPKLNSLDKLPLEGWILAMPQQRLVSVSLF